MDFPGDSRSSVFDSICLLCDVDFLNKSCWVKFSFQNHKQLIKIA